MFPELKTKRLLMRKFKLSDASRIQELAGSRSVAQSTLMIPHPYEDGMAEAWIDTHQSEFESKKSLVLALCDIRAGDLIGAMGLRIKMEFNHAELGYWIGEPFWGNGYATEAAKAILAYGFTVLGLNKIHAHHMTDNAASGKVMQKIGMAFEGRMKQHVIKWGEYKDLDVYGILAETWKSEKEG